jgi:Holliday junction resolvase-like predicted endonuclease
MQPIRTGGHLNVVNEKYRCNDPYRTIRVSTLMRVHAPRTEAAMLALIQAHEQPCPQCSERTRGGGLVGWQDALWRAVQQEHYAGVSMADVQAFVYDLFVRSPVRGFMFEDYAVLWLRNHGYRVRLATPEEDCAWAIDLVIMHRYHGRVVAGVQVKPQSYQYVRSEVHQLNEQKNLRAGYPVYYLYYNNEGRWLNATIVPQLWELVSYLRCF